MHFKDKTLVKGFLLHFHEDGEEVKILTKQGHAQTFYIDDLKAIFFVKDFEGRPNYREKKRYEEVKYTGKRIFVKFYDGEGMLGYILGDFPWEKGFYLSSKRPKRKGFYMIPVDRSSNNEKVFVVVSSVEDVALL